MSAATDIAAKLKAAFPGLRVTSTDRTPAEQRGLIASGATRATNSQHLTGTGVDVVLPKDTTPKQIRDWLTNQGVSPGEFLNETGRGAGQGTGAHLHIGLAPKAAQAKGGDPASADGGSTYDRVVARQRASQGSTLDDLFRARMNAGKPGGMTAQDAAAFDAARAHGQIVGEPAWFKAPAAPKDVPLLPDHLLQAYNSHAMDDDPEARKQIEDAVSSGQVRLKPGQTLKAPPARTVGERLGMGVRDIMRGAGGLVDVVAGPANSLVNAVTGAGLSAHPTSDLANRAANALGLAAPESSTEQLISAANQGATQGLLTAGAGVAASPIEGATGTIGRAVSASPIADTLAGATSGVSAEAARQAGAGPVGQFAAGLVGGAAPVGLAASVERAAARAPATLADVAAATPRAAVIDEAGNLTPHGQEVAVRHGVTPEEVHAAYEAPPSVQASTANDQVTSPVAREATTGQPIESAPEPAAPVEATMPAAAPRTAPEAPATETPQARVAQGQDFGVPYSRGQATKSFDVQDAEQRLRNSNGPEGEAMRQFVATQTQAVKDAVEKFKGAFDDAGLTKEQRGTQVQEAISELRNNGKAGVSALYRQAKELGQAVPLETDGIKQAYERLMVEADVPDQVKNVLTQEAARYGIIGKVEPQGSKSFFTTGTLDNSGVPYRYKKGVVTSENQITTAILDNGEKIRFYGPSKSLALDNAEEFRKAITAQYPADGPRKLTGILKAAIDDATEQAAEKLARYDQPGAEMPNALKAARAAHVEQKQTFHAKDVVQAIADWKKGAEDITRVLTPEQVVDRAFKSVSDLKRVKAVLLSKPTVQSKAAWKALQAHGLAEVFDKATQRNANVGGEITDAISGAKLRTAIESVGVDKLKVLLEPTDFATLMKLRRVIEDVTIPISGTVNHSNSGNLIMRLVRDADNQVTAAFAAAGTVIGGPVGGAIGGSLGRTVAPAIKGVREAKAAGETLRNATEYTPERAATETVAPKVHPARRAAEAVKGAAQKSVSAFIDTYASPRVLAPVLAASTEASQ